MCYLITLTNYIEVTYHNNNTVILFLEEATTSLQLDLWSCHKQVGHQRLIYFDQEFFHCCVVPVATFIKGTIFLFVFNSTASLIES